MVTRITAAAGRVNNPSTRRIPPPNSAAIAQKPQNVGKKWFVITPEGTKNLTCLPAPSKAVAPPADDEEEGTEESGGDAGGEESGSDYSY